MLMYDVIRALEDYCTEHKLAHKFVGGVSYAGLLNPHTTFDIDIKHRIVSLKKHNELTSTRHDQTIRDIDLIVFTPDKSKLLELKQFIKHLPENIKIKDFPHISVEASIYPSMGRMQTWLQFVTSLQVDTDAEFGHGNIYLVFDQIREQISWKSLEDWQIKLENGLSYTVRHPLADYLAYHFRMPSGIKPKDEEKVKLMLPLVHRTLALGKKEGIDYESKEYYGSWMHFVKRLELAHGWTRTKADIMKWYWSSIGTDLAHGKGPVGKFLLNFSNAFTGVQQ